MFLTLQKPLRKSCSYCCFQGIRPVVVALIVAPVSHNSPCIGHRLETGVDSGGGGAADMVEDSISVQSHILYIVLRRTCGIPACEERRKKLEMICLRLIWSYLKIGFFEASA